MFLIKSLTFLLISISIFPLVNFTILGKGGTLYDSAIAVEHFESYFTIYHRIRNRNKQSAICALGEERKMFLCFQISKLILEFTSEDAIIEDDLVFLEATEKIYNIWPYTCTDMEFVYYPLHQSNSRKAKHHSKQMYLCPGYDIILNGIPTSSPSFFVSGGDVKNSAFILKEVFDDQESKINLFYYADELGYENRIPALEGVKIAAEYLDLYQFATKILRNDKVAGKFEEVDTSLCSSIEKTKIKLCFYIMKILVRRRYGRVDYYDDGIIIERKDTNCHEETFTFTKYSVLSGSMGVKIMYSCPKYTLKIRHNFIPNEKIDINVEFYVSGGDKQNTCIVFEREKPANVLTSSYYGYDFEL